MTSSGDTELEKINAELDCLSFKRQQLSRRRQILCKYKEFRKNWEEIGQSEEGASNQHELDSIDEGLKQLSDREAALQKRKENLLNGVQNKKEDSSSDREEDRADLPVPEPEPEPEPEPQPQPQPQPQPVFFVVDSPPSFPAPYVILDLEKLSTHPCKTQCPQCQQFITTEVVSSVSSLTWLVCFTLAVMGCVVGCCLIPFCTKTFKKTSHKCPRCRTLLKNVQVL
ncbi:uncharacterized protein LOC143016558 [Genypterus blacodes]|uniref:uncharacterized protein LOC143016558 n=1 Tax=Genypterus blacodes TaxID=154954 RepID=UPI003F764BBA